MKYAVCILVFAPSGAILGVSRKDDPNAFGTPGGKVDPEDGDLETDLEATLKRAAIRELREETGVVVEAHQLELVWTGDCTGYRTYAYEAAPDNLGRLQSTPGEGVAAWVTWDMLFAGPFSEYNKVLYNHLKSR